MILTSIQLLYGLKFQKGHCQQVTQTMRLSLRCCLAKKEQCLILYLVVDLLCSFLGHTSSDNSIHTYTGVQFQHFIKLVLGWNQFLFLFLNLYLCLYLYLMFI